MNEVMVLLEVFSEILGVLLEIEVSSEFGRELRWKL